MFACRPNFLHVGPPLHAFFLHVEPPPILIFHPLQPGVYGLAGRSGGVGSDGSKWSKFQNPSKKMRLDESFRMVPVSCHLEVVVQSYGQNTVNMSRTTKTPNLKSGGRLYMQFSCMFCLPRYPLHTALSTDLPIYGNLGN